MPDTRVYLVSGKADLACTNCNTTQEHTVDLYWNDTLDRLEVDRVCKCQSVANPLIAYEEKYKVSLSTA